MDLGYINKKQETILLDKKLETDERNILKLTRF